MSEWLAVEAIIRQRDKENTAATIAKVSTTSQSGEGIVGNLLLSGQNPNLSNEVFLYFPNKFQPALTAQIFKIYDFKNAYISFLTKVFDDNSSCEEFDCTTDGETEKGNESESCKDATTTDLSIGQNLQVQYIQAIIRIIC